MNIPAILEQSLAYSVPLRTTDDHITKLHSRLNSLIITNVRTVFISGSKNLFGVSLFLCCYHENFIRILPMALEGKLQVRLLPYTHMQVQTNQR